MPVSVLQGAFTSGELAPSLSARVDLEKYGKSCRTLKNFLVQAHGGAVKRPGFELLDALPGPCALIPFVFNQDQAYCLVFGEGWMRVAGHDGFILGADGNPYQIASPYTLARARALSCVQSADVLFIACHGVRPQKLKRLAHDHWEFEGMIFTAPLDPPAGGMSSIAFVNGAKMSDGSASEAQLVTPYTYFVSAVNADGKESGLSAGAEITGPSSNNWQGGDYVEMSWPAAPGAVEYRIYKATFGGRPGYVATTGGTSWQDYNTAPSVTEGAPRYFDPFPEDDFPGAICLFEQRLVFASSPNRPQTIWMSKSGDYGNFATYEPQTADSPIELTVASQEVAAVNWIVPLRSLIMGMGGMEWEISGRGDAAFSASSAKATPQSYWGSSLKRAIVIGNVILHVSSSGSQVRSLQYEFAADSYGGTDLSIMAAHLLESERVVDWTHQKNPDSVVWAVREDGVLLGLTFQAEHQIAAWHRHETQGAFRAVCAIPHGFEHSLFAVVEREGVFTLERMAERYRGGDPTGAVFLDCALTYKGEAAKTISGLEHLEGKEAGIMADGAVHAPLLVREGRITLDHPASVVTVGLPYTADLETMPVEVLGREGASVGLKKQINAADIIFRDSLGVKVGLNSAGAPGSLDHVLWQEVKWRTTEPYGKPPAPYSGLKSVTLPSMAENTDTICIRSDLPTPVTVLALVSRVQVKQ
jgi:hypothetical protein